MSDKNSYEYKGTSSGVGLPKALKGELESPTEGTSFDKIIDLKGLEEAKPQFDFDQALNPAKRKRAPGAAGF